MSATLAPSRPEARAGRNSESRCRHCGSALLDDAMRASGFCCNGCSYVFRLVHDSGLDRYYRFKDEVTAPADPGIFHPRDYTWLEEAQASADASTLQAPTLTVNVQGISCAACVWLIERVFLQQPGAREIIVNAQYGTAQLKWTRGEFQASAFARRLQSFGYTLGPAGEASGEPESRSLAKRIGLCAAFTMNVMLFTLPVYFGMEATFEWASLFELLSLGFGTLSLLVGGSYFLVRGWRALREGAMHIDLPIALGITGAYAGSLYGWAASRPEYQYFDFVSTFILLMLIGRWAQVAAVERNRRRLLCGQPQKQRIQVEGGASTSPEDLQPQQTIILTPGQTVPVESRLIDSTAVFSLASINGEAAPRIFAPGQRVPAGAVAAGRSSVRLLTLQRWEDSLLAQLLAPQAETSTRHLFLERIVRGYLIGILGIAVIAGISWWLATHDTLKAGAIVTAILVVSCPCAVALAFPLADEMATVALRRFGVFVRDAGLWSRLRSVRRLIFDKTGTLTLETPKLRNPEELSRLDEEARAALLALVSDNAHPVSQCLLEHLLAEGSMVPLSGEVRETIGAGVELGPWSLGRAGWRDTSEGSATVFARNGEVVARFEFSDAVRADAQQELEELSRRGYTSMILSGDDQSKVSALAKKLGIDEKFAVGEMSPQAKAAWLRDNAPGDALMLGDGANDSLAFDQALCRGTPVIHRGVLERKADFYYLGRGIGGIRALLEIDATRHRTQRNILVFSIAYNLLAVGLAVAGKMNPLVAAILMPISSLLTLAIVSYGMRNSQRVRNVPQPNTRLRSAS